jgi:hypothetical protein
MLRAMSWLPPEGSPLMFFEMALVAEHFAIEQGAIGRATAVMELQLASGTASFTPALGADQGLVLYLLSEFASHYSAASGD